MTNNILINSISIKFNIHQIQLSCYHYWLLANIIALILDESFILIIVHSLYMSRLNYDIQNKKKHIWKFLWQVQQHVL